MLDKRKKEIIHTWIAGQSSCTLIIPKPLAQEYGLDKPSHVVVEGKPEGILIIPTYGSHELKIEGLVKYEQFKVLS
jgi:hypothetical protein